MDYRAAAHVRMQWKCTVGAQWQPTVMYDDQGEIAEESYGFWVLK